MRVQLTEIHDAGLEIDCGETAQEIGLEYPDTGVEGRIRTRVRLDRMKDEILLSGVAEAVLVQECGRCSRPFTRPVSLDVQTVFTPQEKARAGGDKDNEGTDEEGDHYLYSGQTIDLGEFVREQILLSLPMVPLCRPDCRGLCPHCGKNLNLESCDCRTEE